MSDDLISRKAVIKAVDKHTREDGTLDDDITCILEEVPIAFYKEKVINEIKKKMEPSIEYDGCYYFPIDEIDRIIKKGGIE